MKNLLLGLLVLLGTIPIFAQANRGLGPTFPGPFAGISSTLPATCQIGTMWFKLGSPAGQEIYTCGVANVWTQSGGTSGLICSAPTTINDLPIFSNLTGTGCADSAVPITQVSGQPFIPVGLVGNGSTDDTSAINAALAAHLNVFLPDPATCYKITSPIQVPNNTTLTFASGQHGGLCNYGNTDAIQSTSSTGGRGIVINNPYITDGISGSRTVGVGIHIRSDNSTSSISRIEGGEINGHMVGIRQENSLNSLVIGTRINNPLQDGYVNRGTLGSTGTSLLGVYVDTPGRYGYYTTQLSYSSWNGLSCDSAVDDCYHFANGDGGRNIGMVLNALGSEASAGNGIYVDGTDFVINSPTITLSGSGTGKAGIVVAGPTNTIINSAWLRNGDYGINVTSDGQLPGTVTVCRPYYITNAIATITGTAGVVRTCTEELGSGTLSIASLTVGSGACSSAVTATVTGTATTDNLLVDFNADPSGATGFSPSITGMLTILKYPTANTVNVKVCNNTGSSITTPASGAGSTLNYRLIR